MSRNILPSALQYLEDTGTVRIAHLIRLELPQSTPDSPTYAYLTDAGKNVYSGGITYLAGRVLSVSSVEQTVGLSSYKMSISVAGEIQEEVDRALNGGSIEASYLNKEIRVTKAYFDSDFNVIPMDITTGGPLELFRGLITNINVKEDVVRGSSVVTWECANHFADFERVNGRLTDDIYHRALVDGVPTNSAKRSEYQKDRGFYHAVGAVNVLAQYQVKEQRFRMKKKKKKFGGGIGGSLLGLASYNLEEYTEIVTKEVDISVNLSAKYIPVVYGVRKVPGIPIFADTPKDDPSKVYVVYAVAEGEITSILDLIIEDRPIVCYNTDDDEARTCLGNQQNGDTIGLARIWNGTEYVDPPTSARDKGSVHGARYELIDNEGRIEFWTYHGKPNQHYQPGVSPLIIGMSADTDAPINQHPLYELAHSTKFFRQEETDNGDIYWGKDFLLLDTAYVVMCFHLSSIDGNRTDIPSVEFVVEGKKIVTYPNGIDQPAAIKNSLNPAWQIYDYLTSKTYGAAVPASEVSLLSIYNTASTLDTIDPGYEADWVRNWRYVGWTAQDNSNRQLMQTNVYLQTESKVFSNVESMLSQFLGTLNLLGNSYHLSLEADYATVADIDYKEAVGAITVKDLSGKSKWNTISASIEDPGLGWGNNQVTFFDSEYLEADKRVERKGNIKFEYITNYYCGRTFVKRILDKSRFSRSVELTVSHKYLFLFPTNTVTFTYPRFGWDKKEFLIQSTTIRPDGLIDLDLIEYGNYIFTPVNQTDAGNPAPPITPGVKPPRSIRFVSNPDPIGAPELNGTLEWNNSLTNNVFYYEVRYISSAGTLLEPAIVYANPENLSTPPTLYTFDLVGLVPGDYTFYVRAITSRGESSRDESLFVPGLLGPDYIDNVTGFVVVNTEPGNEAMNWFGGSVMLQWKHITADDLAGYILEVYTPEGTIRSDTVGITNMYEYTRSMNKQDYLALTGSVGVFRRLSFRIKGRTFTGAQSAQWSVIE